MQLVLKWNGILQVTSYHMISVQGFLFRINGEKVTIVSFVMFSPLYLKHSNEIVTHLPDRLVYLKFLRCCSIKILLYLSLSFIMILYKFLKHQLLHSIIK
jgi:hypothetical protein